VNTPRAAVSSRTRLLELAERRLPALTRLKRSETLPIQLSRHRIYVLPTRFGLLFSAVLLTMLLGALNYNNNPALLLTCLLGAAAYQSVFAAFRTLDRLQLATLRAEPCHAGDTLPLLAHFHIAARSRYGLRLALEGAETAFDLDADGATRISIAAPQRGWLRPGRMRLSSEYPFGLFQVWSWLNPDFRALIYPRLEANAPPLPFAGSAAVQTLARAGGDELASLREYRPTDPPRNIAWKASARHDTLLVREFEQLHGRDVVLDYAALHGLDHEARISRLARWVCMAEAAQQPYSLTLPERRFGPGLGSEHRHACLRLLALLPGAAS
jgi:uncharacterized protein (DUF58 family)